MSDPRRTELAEKLQALVDRRHGGDWRAAFDDYDVDGDGRVKAPELFDLLVDAGVGSRVTRRAWARGVLDALDRDRDGGVGWTEFEAAVAGGG